MNRGDIHWITFPRSEGNGHEQAGRRPAILVQDDTRAAASPLVLAVPLTANVATTRFPGTILIQPTAENSLAFPSVALVFQLRAIDRRRVAERTGAVNPDVLTEMFAVLDELLGRKL